MPRATAILREKVIDEDGNHAPKGPHRHVEGREEVDTFVDVDRLVTDVMADVRRLRGRDR